MRSQIIYINPKDQDFPAVRSKNISDVWNSVRHFVPACTDASSPSSASFTVFESPASSESYCSDDLLRSATKRFGPSDRRQWCSGTREEYCWDWLVTPEKVDDFVKFLCDSQPLPKHYIGPAQLTVTYNSHWIDPISRQKLPFQETGHYLHDHQARSSATVWLSRLSSMSLDACFPFEWVDSEFLAFCRHLATAIPFKLRAKNFRLSVPNKNGTAYVAKKIDLDLQFEIDRSLGEKIG